MIWCIVVAAGHGSRFGEGLPKQYLMLNNKPVIQYSLEVFDRTPLVAGITVVISRNDHTFAQLELRTEKPLTTVTGGRTRAQSVLNGLHSVKLADDDWVLVHDAARPCVLFDDVQNLIRQVTDNQRGGLLVKPVVDTIKYSTDGHKVSNTLRRDHLFAALTPQMFPYRELVNNLTTIDPAAITDESQAFEKNGVRPLLVESSGENIKITYPEDLLVAESILRNRR